MTKQISFQEKFKDRIGIIGKEGVVGLVKQADKEISKSNTTIDKENYNDPRNQSNLSKNGNMILNNMQYPNNYQPIINQNQNHQSYYNQMNTYQPMINQYQPQPIYFPINTQINPYIQNQQTFNPLANQQQDNLYNIQMYSNQNYNLNQNYNQNPNQINYPFNTPLGMNLNNYGRPSTYGNFSPLNNNFPTKINTQIPTKVLPNLNSNSNLNHSEYNEEVNPQNLNNRNRMKQKNSTSSKINITTNDMKPQTQNPMKPLRALSSKYRSEGNDSIKQNQSYTRDKIYGNNDRAQSSNMNSISKINDTRNENSLYKPYTVKEFRDLNINFNLGGLGPNIGTKEWEEKNQKMKKIAEYSEKVKSVVKLKPIVPSPEEIIEKVKKEKIDSSTRSKVKNYAKQIKMPKPNRIENIAFNSENSNYEFEKIEKETFSENQKKESVEEIDDLKRKKDLLSHQVNLFKDEFLNS